MPKQTDIGDKNRSREIWEERRTKLNVRAIHREIKQKFERELREVPSETTLRNWIKEWLIKDIPDDQTVPLWDKSWPKNAQDIATLTQVYEVGRQVWDQYGSFVEHRGFAGFPRSICDWAPKLAGHFDLASRHECLVLIYFAHVFGRLGRYSETHSVPLSEVSQSATRLLVLWAGTKDAPNLAPNKITHSWFGFLWDRDEGHTELLIIEVMLDEFVLECGLLVPDVIELDTFLDWSGENRENLAPNKTRQEILAEYQAQGIEVDESHDGLGIVYTNPEENEIPEQFWPLLEAQAWQRPSEERPRVFETSEAQVMIAAIMESYPGRLSEDEINELVLELERKFAEIDARNSAD